MNETIRAIRSAAHARAEADGSRRRATAELREHVLKAREEGLPITQIAREAKLSRQTVYSLMAASTKP